jgi:hypothetical protein
LELLTTQRVGSDPDLLISLNRLYEIKYNTKMVSELHAIQSIEDDSTTASQSNVSKCNEGDVSLNHDGVLEQELKRSGCATPPPVASPVPIATPPLVLDREDGAEKEKSPRSPQFHFKKERFHYRNFSTLPIPEGMPPSSTKPPGGDVLAIQKLPTKLYALLSNPTIQHIISWLPHGRSWKVHDSKLFMEEVMPHYFPYTNNYYSFIRLVNAWGFRRISRGPSRNSYWHEVSIVKGARNAPVNMNVLIIAISLLIISSVQMFLRGLPHLHSQMRRLTVKDKKEALDPDDEPDLFEQSRLHPLPLTNGMALETRHPINNNHHLISYQQQLLQKLQCAVRRGSGKSADDVVMIEDDEEGSVNTSPRSILAPSSGHCSGNINSSSIVLGMGMIRHSSSSSLAPRPMQDMSALMIRHQHQLHRRRALLAASINAAYSTSCGGSSGSSTAEHLYLPTILDGPSEKVLAARRQSFSVGGGTNSSSASSGASTPPTSNTTTFTKMTTTNSPSQALRLQQVELAATRRAIMEARLEKLRSEQERLALVAAMASSSSSSNRQSSSLTSYHHQLAAAATAGTTPMTTLRAQQARYHMSQRAAAFAAAAASLPPSLRSPRFDNSTFLPQHAHHHRHHDWM